MEVGIVCAGDREVAPFIPLIRGAQTSRKAMLTFYEGKIEGVSVVALYSGVCKVNAAIATQILIDTYECDLILNAGTAGGMAADVGVFDTIVSTEAAYHDVAQGILTEFHPWMQSVYFQANPQLLSVAQKAVKHIRTERRIWFGRMVTGEKFIEDDQRSEINRTFAPLSVDMETAAIAHVCYVNQKPFLAVRTITDTADHQAAASFEENCKKAAEISAEFVKGMLHVSEWGEKDEV